ncbi:hypothetical protein [Pseudovibrio sp. SPO723]|uniref:hypothetical protein n=1 Tax=Nesiotobacter zosterae TaxID=392721 RepID=UPI0029C5BC95|nr:hypothetical protein [Pseudovibrio sp. SPO723]MDX5594453.1 hypothetical protein [Pseudovibrio sp. SPO723]
MRLKSLLICAGFIAFGLLPGTSVSAEGQDKAPDFIQSIQVYEAVISYPPPMWIKAGEPIGQSEYFRHQNGPEFIFEQIPKGQKFESWTQLYAVRGDYIKLDQDVSLDAYLSMSLQPFIDICGQENATVQRISESGSSGTFLLICQDTPHAPEGGVYGKGTGEVALFHFAKVNDTFVKVYHEWRGKSFLVQNPETWPVKQDVLVSAIERFQSISVFAAN